MHTIRNPPSRAAGNTTNSSPNYTQNRQNRQGSSLEKIESALNFLSPDCDRDIWVKIGMAVKDCLGENGYQLWESWSSDGDGYNSVDCRDVWRSIKPGGGITGKTLFKMAYEAGWRWEDKRQVSKSPKPQPSHGKSPAWMNEGPSSECSDFVLPEEEQSHPESQEPTTDFSGFLAECSPAEPSHPYLTKKGILPNGALQHGGNLVIPVQTEFGNVAGMQFIQPDGFKRFSKGTKKSGNFFLIGTTLAELENQKLLVCEGFATGATLFQATGYPIAVAFDAGNFAPVAEVFKRRFPEVEVILCGDSDANGVGQEAARKAATKTSSKMALPVFTDAELAVPPGKKPPSDWNDVHQSHGLDSVRQGIAAAQHVLAKPEPSEACNQPTRQELATLIEATEDFDILTGEIAQQVAESGLPEPAIQSLLKHIAKKCRVSVASLKKDTPSYQQTQRNEKGHLKSALKAVSILGGKENLIFDGRNMYTWDAKGVWRVVDDREIKQTIHLDGIFDEELTKSIVDSICDLVKTETYQHGHKFEHGGDIINCKNGELHFVDSEWSLKPHNRESYRTTQIPVTYDETATAQKFQEFLYEIFLGDEDAEQKAVLVCELIGYSFMATCRYEKFVLLIGNGANGKSVLLSLVGAIVGRENVCAVQPSQFENRFQRAHLHGKLANLVTEIAEGAEIADAQLKAIVSGELTTAEHKHKPPFDFEPFCTCWFGTNHLPHTRDFSDALFRRAIPIRFNRKFEGKSCNPQLKEELVEELPGILILALDAIAGVFQRGTFTVPKSSELEKRQWRNEADQASQFLDEIYEKIPGERELSSHVWQKYQQWTNDSGIKRPLNRKNLTARLKVLGVDNGKGTHGERMIFGIRQRTLPMDW